MICRYVYNFWIFKSNFKTYIFASKNFVVVNLFCFVFTCLRGVEWVALIRFLFGMWHYQSTRDFAFFKF